MGNHAYILKAVLIIISKAQITDLKEIDSEEGGHM